MMQNVPSRSLQRDCSRLLRRALRARECGEWDKAVRLYSTLLQYHPGDFDALHGLGQIHFRHGRFDMAASLFQSALKADPERAEGFASLGLVFCALKQFERAFTSFDAGLHIEPDNVELLNRRGVALLELGRPLEALEDFERVLAADPGQFEALGNFGNTLLKLNRPQQALAIYGRALTVAPDNAQLLTNRAVALRRLDRPHEALMSTGRALVSQPNFAQARFVESVTRLTLGDFAAGWRGYESRWDVGLLATQRRTFTPPLWLGKQPLDGKTILLHAEQGSGDTIQFVRYAPLLAARGATKILLEVQRELVRLMSPTSGVAAVIARGQELPSFDCHCPLLSLPLAFATELATIPARIPYVAPPAGAGAAWRDRLPRRRPLVGLVWSGGQLHDNDLNRSMRLATLAPLLDLPDATFISLQHEVREADAKLLHNCPNVLHIGDEFRDFADTAAAIAQLDLVIAVDTAVAHLTGAMGKPLFLLLPFAADFRWLRERHDSPWYPSARLFRQPKFGDWDSVIDALRQEVMQASYLAAPSKMSA
jgi:tetratricopeptide (TPR) repeat protein